MSNSIVKEHWGRFRGDPRWAMKFVAITAGLGVLGKLMLVGVNTQCGLTPTTAQFVPILPMFVLTFMAHRYLWRRNDVSIASYVGGLWSGAYVIKLLVGHGAFTVCTTVFGWGIWWQYLAVSMAIGGLMAAATFAINEKILGRREETKIATG